MSLLKLWASAEQSSDLKHHEWDCHVDILGAVGMAGISDGYLAVYRVKYLQDVRSIDKAQQQFIYWTRKALTRRRVRVSPNALGVDILYQWVDDVCKTCQGRQYQSGGSRLIERECPDCKGSGKQRATGSTKDRIVVTLDVIERAEQAMETLRFKVYQKLNLK